MSKTNISEEFSLPKKCVYQMICTMIIMLILLYLKVNDVELSLIQATNYFGDMNSNENGFDFDLSIIVATRNDDHSSNPILRLKLFLNQFIMYEWKKKHGMNVEVNVIEWNYIENRPHVNENNELKGLLEYNKIHQNAIIKFYKIPPKYNDTKHCMERYNLNCSFPQYFAKNIGIRRSNGKWVLITNMDDVFSIKLMDLIGSHISNNLFDINGVYQAGWDERNYSEIIANHTDYSLIKTIYDIKGTNFPLKDCMRQLGKNGGGVMGWAGDFTLLRREHIFNNYVGGYVEACSSHGIDTEFTGRQLYLNNLNSYRIAHRCSYVHIRHKRSENRKKSPCMRAYTGTLWRFILKNSSLKNWTENYQGQLKAYVDWKYVYKLSNLTWGLRNISFNPDIY